jgi:hypothetical protein
MVRHPCLTARLLEIPVDLSLSSFGPRGDFLHSLPIDRATGGLGSQEAVLSRQEFHFRVEEPRDHHFSSPT